MKLMRSAVVVGLVKKGIDEARKPKNQARIRSAVSSVKNRGKSGGAGSGTPPTTQG